MREREVREDEEKREERREEKEGEGTEKKERERGRQGGAARLGRGSTAQPLQFSCPSSIRKLPLPTPYVAPRPSLQFCCRSLKPPI
jgi:hypothetical protein